MMENLDLYVTQNFLKKKSDKIIKIYPLLCMVKKEARAVKYKLTTAAKEKMGALQALTLCLRKRAFFFG